jgi:hypothetical protein
LFPTFTVPAHGSGKAKVVITPPADADRRIVRGALRRIEAGIAQATPEGNRFTPIFVSARWFAVGRGSEDYRIAVTETRLTPPPQTETSN